MDYPLLSVIIPTYNRETSVINRALASIQNQSYPNLELFLVDDNRSNATLSQEIIDLIGGYPSNFHYIKNTGSGAQAARNLGYEYSSGKYLAFLDDDDYWLRENASMLIALAEKNAAVLAFSQAYEKNTDTGIVIDDPITLKIKVQPSYKDLLLTNYIGTTSRAIIKRSAFEQVGGFDERVPARQDYELWLRIAQVGLCIGTKERGMVYCVHNGDQITKHPSKAIAGITIILEKNRDGYSHDPLALFARKKDIYRLSRQSTDLELIQRSRQEMIQAGVLALRKQPFLLIGFSVETIIRYIRKIVLLKKAKIN